MKSCISGRDAGKAAASVLRQGTFSMISTVLTTPTPSPATGQRQRATAVAIAQRSHGVLAQT